MVYLEILALFPMLRWQGHIERPEEFGQDKLHFRHCQTKMRASS